MIRAGMTECVICSQQYQDVLSRCPTCGCPDYRYELREFGFPGSVGKSYRLVSVRLSGGTRPRLILENRAGGERVSAALLPKSRRRGAFLEKLHLQRELGIPYLPQVLRIEEAESGGYFFYQAVEAETLAELMEQEFPLGGSRAEEIAGHIMDALDVLKQYGYEYGSLLPEQIVVRGTQIMFTDYGDGMTGRGDGMTIKELRRYMASGRAD